MENVRFTLLTAIAMLASSLGAIPATVVTGGEESQRARLILKSTEECAPLHGAVYLKSTGLDMINRAGFFSPDRGQTWTFRPFSPDFDSKLPYGYRRVAYPPFVDPVNGKIIKLILSLDTPGLNPGDPEPPIGEKAYYLRYRVSVDGGKTYLFDTPIVQKGKTPDNPFDDIRRGNVGFYVGDSGSQVIRTRSGRIIIPAQAGLCGPDGKLWNPSGLPSYNVAMMILGSWQEDNTIQWEAVRFIKGDPARSMRGMIEPTLAEMSDGRLLCVMRGSNGGSKDPMHCVPSYKWYSVSSDDGDTWTKPEPWTYDDGKPFFSPSAMSQLLKHSSGRCFWIGNISPSNCRENAPRYPLVIGEVDSRTLRLIESTVLVIDTKRPDEPGVNLSHWWGFEDRPTHDIVLAGRRCSEGYKTSTPVTYRISVR